MSGFRRFRKGIRLTTNPSLTSLDGLGNLASVGGGLTILSNDNLASLSALGNLSAIGGSLTLSGDILTSLSGLDNIGPATITCIFMENSPNLSMCDVPSICNYLSVPGNPAVIGNNASGCNTRGEILEACQASTGTASQTAIAVQVYPNPTRGRVEAAGLKEGKAEVLNNLGQKVMGMALSEAGIDLSELPAGIYFIKIRSGNRWGTGRVVKE